MHRFRANSPVPCTRWPFMRRRRAKDSTRSLKCGAGSLGLEILELGVARHRDDAQRGDAVALAAEHPKAEAMEGEALAALGNRTCFMNHQPGHRGRLLVGQAPIHRAIEIRSEERRV